MYFEKVGSQGVSDQCLCYLLALVIFKAVDSILQFTGSYLNYPMTKVKGVHPALLYSDASIEHFSRQVLAIYVLLLFANVTSPPVGPVVLYFDASNCQQL